MIVIVIYNSCYGGRRETEGIEWHTAKTPVDWPLKNSLIIMSISQRETCL